VPYRGKRLAGDDLHRQLDRWVAGGIVEPTCAEAVRTVMANPDWLDLSDRRTVVLGAGAEMGPLTCPGRRSGSGCWARPRGTAGGCTCRSAAHRTTTVTWRNGPAPTSCTICRAWRPGCASSTARWC